jgi:SDR family mycofactocin-dependent oxidoreductase
MTSAERLAGKVALVTGAARGIGKACAIRLAEAGADVCLVDLAGDVETVPYAGARSDELSAGADEVRAIGRRAISVAADVRDEATLRDAAARAVADWGSLDVLVAAAGVNSWADAWELSDSQWAAVMDVNLGGVWRAAKVAAPHMIRQKRGAMVFIGSVNAHKPIARHAHYTASKHGVLGLMRAFALELAPFLVRVNSVDPTSVLTEMFLNQPFLDRLAGHRDATLEEVAERNLHWNTMPLPWVEPVDVANAVLFLASDEARYITGISLPVDLGAMLK